MRLSACTRTAVGGCTLVRLDRGRRCRARASLADRRARAHERRPCANARERQREAVNGALVQSIAAAAAHTRAGALATRRHSLRRRSRPGGGRVDRSNGRAPSLVASRAASSSGCAPPCRTTQGAADQMVTLRGTVRPAHVTWMAETPGRVRSGHEPEERHSARLKLALLAWPHRALCVPPAQEWVRKVYQRQRACHGAGNHETRHRASSGLRAAASTRSGCAVEVAPCAFAAVSRKSLKGRGRGASKGGATREGGDHMTRWLDRAACAVCSLAISRGRIHELQQHELAAAATASMKLVIIS